MTAVEIPPEFGYVVLVVVFSGLVLTWLAINVGKARKKYDVKYPTMYSDKEPMFNCVQRGHQNALEGYPLYLVLQIFSGLQYPCLCAGAGLVYIFSRISYAQGYYTGDPAKRSRGFYGYAGLITMLVCSVIFALDLLGFV